MLRLEKLSKMESNPSPPLTMLPSVTSTGILNPSKNGNSMDSTSLELDSPRIPDVIPLPNNRIRREKPDLLGYSTQISKQICDSACGIRMGAGTEIIPPWKTFLFPEYKMPFSPKPGLK